MLEKPRTSASTTISAIKATRRLRVIRVIDREKLGTRCGAGRSRRARAPPATRQAAATAAMVADRMNGAATPSRSMARPPAMDPTAPARNTPRLPSAMAFVAPPAPTRSNEYVWVAVPRSVSTTPRARLSDDQLGHGQGPVRGDGGRPEQRDRRHEIDEDQRRPAVVPVDEATQRDAEQEARDQSNGKGRARPPGRNRSS